MPELDKQINITTTGVEITPYYKYQCRYLEKLTSTYDAVRHRGNPVTGFFIDSEVSNQSFVTHLHDSLFLQNLFPKYTVNHVKQNRHQPLSIPININSDITPREVQYELIQDVLSSQDKHQWFIYLSQGLGKTLLSIYLISHFNTKSLIMCYSKAVLEQWYHNMKDKTDIDPKKILMIDSSKLFYKILIGEFPVWEYDIFMCTPGILVKFGNKYGFQKLHPLMTVMGIGFKIFDEAHRNIANIIKINGYTSVNRTLYLSGDFGQSADNKQRLYYNMFYNVPILKPSEELMDTLKFTEAIVIEYNSKPSELDKTSVYSKRGFSFYDYMKYQMRRDIFYDVLHYVIDMISKANENKYKVLILVNMIEHVDYLYDHLKESCPDYIVGRYHSGVSDEEKQLCKNSCNMIISTYQSFSTGIDVSLIKYVISCSVCTKIDDNQASGRARPLPDNSSAFYFMFADTGFDYTKKSINKRLTYLQETKIKQITKVQYFD